MAKLTNGIMGPIKGKIGHVIGSSWKGIPYLKARARKRTKRVGKGEAANRSKFAMAQFWLRPLLGFVRQGFKGYSPTSEGFVAAKSYLLLNAVEGLAPDYVINPALVQLSFGDLPLPDDMAVGLVDDNHLEFTWERSSTAEASPFDQVMLMAYDVEDKTAYYTITGQFRHTGNDRLMISAQPGRNYHLYFAMVADDRSRQSHSVYMGQIKI
jgi:Family of unknown function (DUF6266)